MDTPNPNFVSQVVSSSETIAGIEEHNSAARLEVSHGPVPATQGLSVGSGTPNNSSTDSPLLLSRAPFADVASSFEHFPVDGKGLSLALEVSEEAHPLTHIGAEAAGITDIGQTLVTAETLGFIENLSQWMEERLGASIVGQWGNAEGSKPLASLWSELAQGESALEDSRPPKRTTNVVSVNITNSDGDVLVEAWQEMSDGSRRARNRPLSEKMRPGEDVTTACLRGIAEELGPELGSSDRVTLVPDTQRKTEKEEDSISYPGLPTKYVIYSVEARVRDLPSTEFDTEENESDAMEGIAQSGDVEQLRGVGVKTHFWKWIPELELAKISS